MAKSKNYICKAETTTDVQNLITAIREIAPTFKGKISITINVKAINMYNAALIMGDNNGVVTTGNNSTASQTDIFS